MVSDSLRVYDALFSAVDRYQRLPKRVPSKREFGHIINLCVYRHYDIGIHMRDQIHEYV